MTASPRTPSAAPKTDTTDATDTTEPAAGTGRKPPRRRKRAALLTMAAVVVAAGTSLAVTRPWNTDHDAVQSGPRDTTTKVERTSLSSGMKISGRLSYDAPTDVIAQGQGMITWLPAPGDTINAGGKLYETDGESVVMFTGGRPLWRELAAGVSNGPDVKQLERNLVVLGYAKGLGLTVDEKFTAATATAVKRWQKATGLTQTGRVPLGRVVMLPQRTVRVQEVPGKLGSAAAVNTVVKVSGTALVAIVQPGEDQLSQFGPGRQVTIRLNGGAEIPGKVRSMTPGSGGNGGDEGIQDKPTVTITLADQDAARTAGQSSVTVTLIGTTVDDALVVPVTALLALDGGGYGVEVVTDGTTRLVRVELGLIANAKVQVTGDIREGDTVVIPE
ncbi:peptidoglycan-binding protein [Micromonospora sp. NBC_01412]|uniref:peptidoglycan-binding protein n=1 Tax=Micromonospora sp. NBC_01412 TaxID=2903590 RepID=UPI00324F011D